MADEAESPELLRLPFKQKDAWEWAFRAAMLAAYFWSTGHFVSVERYEKGLESEDRQRAAISDNLTTTNNLLGRIDERIKNDERRDKELDDLEHRLRALENPNSNRPR